MVKQMDHASLDEIADAITAELDAIAAENNIAIEYEVYSGQGDQSVLMQIGDQAVADGVDAIIPVATLAAQVMAVCAEDSQTPVIFAAISDPEAAELTGIDYVTGTSDALDTESVMEMMLAQNPDLQNVGLLYSLSEPNSAMPIEEAKAYLEAHYFVTPSRAALALETGATAAKAARRLERRDIDVYVGIPFCPTRCAYCSFVSQSVERSFALVPPYVDALCAEITAGGGMVRRAGLRVRTFYMGGGTPTTLTAEQMDRVLTAFETAFDRAACEELTVEAGRPDTITAEKLAVLKSHGVTRVSVNPQTFEEPVLRAIGRRHTAADIDAAMDLVARCGFPHVNMDLIAGLPEDTAEGFRRSLDRCLSYGPDDITVHTLALKKGSRILTQGLRIPGAETVAAMLDYAGPALRDAGYRPYYLYRQKYMSGSFENIGWCRGGGECWYNVDIMSELCSILSFGAAGSTKMVVPGTNQIQRAFNVKYPTEYIQRPEKWQANQAAFAAFYEAL